MKRNRSFPSGPEDYGGRPAGIDSQMDVKVSTEQPRTTELSREPFEFSLVGGPVDRLFHFLHLSDSNLYFPARRVAVIIAFTWLPLLLLSFFEGHAMAGDVQKPFLRDIETHIRLLVALPLLLAGDTLIRRILDPRVKPFLIRNIVRSDDIPKFLTAIKSAHRMRDSVAIVLILIVIVYSLGLFIYSRGLATTSTAWNLITDGTAGDFTLAGYWMLFVSVPVFQFFLIRWYVRILNWSVLLWRISRLNLNLIATHADRNGGIGFLAISSYGFTFFLVAHGALLSAYIANQVMNHGQDPMGFKLVATAFVALFLGMVFIPLTVFTPKLLAAKWKGKGIYGNLISRYVQGFEGKWIDGNNPESEELLGTSDIQSLADIGNSYAVAVQMKLIPLGIYEVTYLTAYTLAPLVPLLLFIFSLEDLVGKLVSILL